MSRRQRKSGLMKLRRSAGRCDQRLVRATHEGGPVKLDFDSFRDGQRVLKLYAKIPHSAVHFGVPEQELNGAEVARLFVDLGDFCASHRMRAVGARFQSNRCHPVPNNTRVLASGDVQALMKPARP